MGVRADGALHKRVRCGKKNSALFFFPVNRASARLSTAQTTGQTFIRQAANLEKRASQTKSVRRGDDFFGDFFRAKNLRKVDVRLEEEDSTVEEQEEAASSSSSISGWLPVLLNSLPLLMSTLASDGRTTALIVGVL